jgi:hypothetical protein
MENYADLIDTLACTIFGTASIGGAAWLIENIGCFCAPYFLA